MMVMTIGLMIKLQSSVMAKKLSPISTPASTRMNWIRQLVKIKVKRKTQTHTQKQIDRLLFLTCCKWVFVFLFEFTLHSESSSNLGDHSLDLSLGNSSSKQNDSSNNGSIGPQHHSSSSSSADWQRNHGFRPLQVILFKLLY